MQSLTMEGSSLSVFSLLKSGAHCFSEAGVRSESNSKFKGVRKRKWGKYVSEIRLPNSRERIWLGSYDSAEKAARAFDAALFCLRGRTAKFNFPNNPPEIPGGRSLKAAEIQTAAARFANSESSAPPKSESNSGHHLEMNNNNNNNSSSSFIPSPSVSEATVETVQIDSDSISTNNLDGSFLDFDLDLDLDFLKTMGSINYGSDYGIFPGFDDLTNGLFTQPLSNVDYGEENLDGIASQESYNSFLWNF
ncbi:ethylene-responsive transcription factor erf017 [Quercus suber]|uniref:Ethylene-responsive transcription factor erf017 n=1 Tax=Quercus suber TaxID=58331 RepID=A0AAW0LAE5_QUESU